MGEAGKLQFSRSLRLPTYGLPGALSFLLGLPELEGRKNTCPEET